MIHTSQQVGNVQLTPPDGAEPIALAAIPVDEQPTDARGPAVAIAFPEMRRAGVYRLAWDEGPLGTQQDVYAANPDARESRLERIEADELKTMMEPLDVEVVAVRGDGAEQFSPTGREIWRDLACVLLVLLLVESIFATWVGRSR